MSNANGALALSNHRRGMIWIELTNGCNLNCGHCYSDSFPGSGKRDTLSHDDYIRVIAEASFAGMSTVQFIGGEPMLYKRLPELVQRAQSMGFEHVEIFSNLTIDRPDVLDAINPDVTTMATSVYTDDPIVHDRITKRLGSFSRTMANIRLVLDHSIRLRAGFIEMESNRGHFDRTARLLQAMGVQSVGYDRVREFGRGGVEQPPDMRQLCGSCAGDTLCVSYDGAVLPCIMSRAWPIGDVKQTSLKDIWSSAISKEVRAQILEATKDKQHVGSPEGLLAMPCNPDACVPSQPNCQPLCQPACYPGQQCNPCHPSGASQCPPNQRCNPIGTPRSGTDVSA